MSISSEPAVLVGSDGWLFLGAGSNQFDSYLRGEQQLPEQTISYWASILTQRRAHFSKLGIKYLHVFAPEKASVYSEHYPEPVVSGSGHIEVLHAELGDLFLNPLGYFRDVKDAFRLYDKTDTHWNRSGALACFQLACSALDIHLSDEWMSDLMTGEIERWNALLDLGSKVIPNVREDVDLIRRPAKSKIRFANLIVRYKEKHRCHDEVGLHVGSRIVFRNFQAPHNDVVVLYGDSFSDYRPGRLTEFFSETFREVHYIWSSNIDYDYVRSVGATMVVSELCERFATVVPNDQVRTDHFARERLVDYLRKKRALEGGKGGQSGEAGPYPVVADTRSSTWGIPLGPPRLKRTGQRAPDFIIGGAMKCGTTILYDYLAQHPEIRTIPQKEVHYFSYEIHRGERWYGDIFAAVPDDLMTGEASPSYMNGTGSELVPKLIDSTLPGVKVILVIKDPVDRALSHFNHLRDVNNNADFQSLDIDQFFSGDLSRKHSREFLEKMELWPGRHILEFGLYAQDLLAYRRVFGDRVLILEGDDLWKSGQATMTRLFRFLGLPDHRSDHFQKKRYVTDQAKKSVSPKAIASLEKFYEADRILLKRHFGIVLR